MLGGHTRERRCPRCGTRVAQQAQSCVLCGYRLGRGNYVGALLSLIAVAVVAGIAVGALRDRASGALAASTAAAMRTPGTAIALAATAPREDVPTQVREPSEAAEPTPAQSPTKTSTPTSTPSPTATATLEPTPTPSETPAPTVEPTATPTAGPIIHVVESGDSLLYLAKKYGSTVDEIAAANNITEYTILSLGQELVIPVAAGGAAEGASSGTPEATGTLAAQFVIHIVEAGDTLDYLASKYGSSVDAIVTANEGITKTSTLAIGQEVKVPLAQPTAQPDGQTVTPTAESTPVTPIASGTPAAETLASPTIVATSTLLDMGGPAQPRALELLSPTGGAKVPLKELMLNWTGGGEMAPDLWYVVNLWPVNEYSDKVIGWTKANSWRPAEDLAARWGVSAHLMWSVGVEREVYGGEEAPQFEPAGPRTEPQDFYLLP